MKATILLITSPFMLMFVIAAFQTIEWNIENGTPVPLAVYILLLVAAVWCVCAAKMNKSDLDEFNN